MYVAAQLIYCYPRKAINIQVVENLCASIDLVMLNIFLRITHLSTDGKIASDL